MAVEVLQQPSKRQTFGAEVFGNLRRADPVVVVNGDTYDDMPGENGTYVDLQKLIIRDAVKNNKYDYVMVFNAANGEITFADEIKNGTAAKASPKMRDSIKEMDLEINDEGGDANLAEPLLQARRVRSSFGLADRVVVELLKKLVEKDKKVLLVIDNINFLIPTSESPAAHPDRATYEGVMIDLLDFLKEEGNGQSHVILLDRGGDKVNGVLRDKVKFVGVPFTTQNDVRALIAKVIDIDKHPEALVFAAGSRITDLRRWIEEKGVADKKPDEVLKLLTKFKQEHIAALTQGAVHCVFEQYTDDMVALLPAEKEWLRELASVITKDSALVPQALGLAGPPGTGKSVRGRYLATLMGVPCLEVKDISCDGWSDVGLKKLKAALEAAIRIKPCVLYIDEIDKMMPHTEGERRGDSGENNDARVQAYFQSMLDSEEMKGVFVIGTGNDFDQMNTAMRRNGRFGLIVACLPPRALTIRMDTFTAVLNQFAAGRGIKVNPEILSAVLESFPIYTTGSDYKELIRRTLLTSASKSMSFDDALLKEAKTFKIKFDPKVEVMTHKAISMHSAPFPLEYGNDDDDTDPESPAAEGKERPIDLVQEWREKLDEVNAELQRLAEKEAAADQARQVAEGREAAAHSLEERTQQIIDARLSEKEETLKAAIATEQRRGEQDLTRRTTAVDKKLAKGEEALAERQAEQDRGTAQLRREAEQALQAAKAREGAASRLETDRQGIIDAQLAREKQTLFAEIATERARVEKQLTQTKTHGERELAKKEAAIDGKLAQGETKLSERQAEQDRETDRIRQQLAQQFKELQRAEVAAREKFLDELEAELKGPAPTWTIERLREVLEEWFAELEKGIPEGATALNSLRTRFKKLKDTYEKLLEQAMQLKGK
ncbi:MAG: AAA family ATPase [Candidatus Gracilibacteria bacterium]